MDMSETLVDLHAHVLLGLDDGPATMTDALAVLRAMRAEGIATVVASAHAFDGRYNATSESILRAVAVTQAAIDAEGLGIRLIPAMEAELNFDLLRAASTGDALGIGGSRQLIVELPGDELPHYAERALFELALAGYAPIINHPERNRALQRHPGACDWIFKHSAAIMLTAASLLGHFGVEAKRASERWLRAGYTCLIVSDAHDTSHRAPVLRRGLEAAATFGKADQSAEQTVLRRAVGC